MWVVVDVAPRARAGEATRFRIPAGPSVAHARLMPLAWVLVNEVVWSNQFSGVACFVESLAMPMASTVPRSQICPTRIPNL